MKIRMGFKTPDALYYTMKDSGLSQDDDAYYEVEAFLRKYVKHGEVINIEFDTEKQTVTVLEV